MIFNKKMEVFKNQFEIYLGLDHFNGLELYTWGKNSKYIVDYCQELIELNHKQR